MTGRVAGRVAVIGGGISGLATAALLARDGYQVSVFERRDRIGGRASTWTADGYRFDEGPSWYLMPEVFDHFFRLFGTSAAEQLSLVQLDPGYRVYFEPGPSGQPEPVEIAASAGVNITRFEAIEKGAGRALASYLASAAETYQIALDRFLYSTFADLRPILSTSVLRRTPRLLRLLLTPLERYVAARFTEPRLRQILGYPAVFLGSSPQAAPSMYHLMSHLDVNGGVLYPMGGISALIQSIRDLAVAQGVQIYTDAEVTQILTKPVGAARPTVLGVRYRDAAGTEQTFAAGIVVATADLHHTETQLLPRPLQTYPAPWWQRKVVGPSALLIYLGVRGQLPQLRHHTLFFARDWSANFDAIFGAHPSIPVPASVYVCRPSATDPGVAPPGNENLFVLVPLPADPELGRGGIAGGGDQNIEDLADTVLAQIAQWAGIPDLAERVLLRRTVGPGDFLDELNSWRGSALGPAHTLRQSAFFRAGNVSKRVDGLYYAGGSTIPGIGLPMCLISAELVLKRLRGDTSAGPLPEPGSR